jgi:hypothetical protein
MMYEAEELTPLGNAAKATRAGASGGESNNVIKTGSLTATWQAVLYSKLVASSEHLTHTGNRRICLRLWDPNGSAAQVRFRLEWRVLGSTNWIVNDEQSTYLVGNFSYIDLGEVRPEIAVLGNQRWECRVTAKTVGENEQEAQMDLLMIIPTEQYAIVQAFIESTAGGPVIWEDTFVQEAGNATGKKAPVGGTYEGFGSATDFKVNEGVLERG